MRERHGLGGAVCCGPRADPVVVVVPDRDAVPVASYEVKDVCGVMADKQMEFVGTMFRELVQFPGEERTTRDGYQAFLSVIAEPGSFATTCNGDRPKGQRNLRGRT